MNQFTPPTREPRRGIIKTLIVKVTDLAKMKKTFEALHKTLPVVPGGTQVGIYSDSVQVFVWKGGGRDVNQESETSQAPDPVLGLRQTHIITTEVVAMEIRGRAVAEGIRSREIPSQGTDMEATCELPRPGDHGPQAG